MNALKRLKQLSAIYTSTIELYKDKFNKSDSLMQSHLNKAKELNIFIKEHLKEQ
jgi:hypothetical protein